MGIFGKLFGIRKKGEREPSETEPEEFYGFPVTEEEEKRADWTWHRDHDDDLEEHRLSIETLDIPHPCGFDFSYVPQIYYRCWNPVTGELHRENWTYPLDGANFDKFSADLKKICLDLEPFPFFYADFIGSEYFCSLYREFDDRDACSSSAFDIPLRWNGTANVPSIEISPPTKSGRVRKYPITLWGTAGEEVPLADDFMPTMLASHRNSIVTDFSYLKNGAVGKGRIVFWHRRNGYLVEFESDENGYFARRAKEVELPNSEWVTVYDVNRL